MFRELNEAPRHENIWKSGDIASRILNLVSRSSWVVKFTSRPPYSRKKPTPIE